MYLRAVELKLKRMSPSERAAAIDIDDDEATFGKAAVTALEILKVRAFYEAFLSRRWSDRLTQFGSQALATVKFAAAITEAKPDQTPAKK